MQTLIVMLIFVVLHWMTYQKQSKEIKRLQLLIKLHNEHMKTAIQEAEEAQSRIKKIQSARKDEQTNGNKSRRESLQKEIKGKLDGNK
jgi:predicted Holliday junction resolvase-like endonuclease